MSALEFKQRVVSYLDEVKKNLEQEVQRQALCNPEVARMLESKVRSYGNIAMYIRQIETN